MKRYILNILIAGDQLMNAIFLGYPDETMSARCWRERKRAPYKQIQPVLDWFFYVCFKDKNHCWHSYLSEKLRKQSPRIER